MSQKITNEDHTMRCELFEGGVKIGTLILKTDSEEHMRSGRFQLVYSRKKNASPSVRTLHARMCSSELPDLGDAVRKARAFLLGEDS